MAFVEAKCSACGGAIQLDDAKESGFCMYCGTRVLLSEAIPQKVRVEGIQTLDSKLHNAETYIKLGEIEKAISLLNQITEDFTSDYRAWWTLAKVKHAFDYFYNQINPRLTNNIERSKEYKYVISLANADQMERVNKEYLPYNNIIESNREESERRRRATLDGDYQYINHSYSDYAGFEVINGKLCKWEYKFGDSLRAIQIRQVNAIDIGLISIYEDVITIHPNMEFKAGKEMPDVLKKHFEYKKIQEIEHQREDKKFTIWLIAVSAFFIVFTIFVVLINILPNP